MDQQFPHFVGMFFILTVLSGLLGHIPQTLSEDYRAWKERRREART